MNIDLEDKSFIILDDEEINSNKYNDTMGVILFIITPFVLFLGALSLLYYILTIYHAFYILLLPFSGLYLLCYKKYKLGLKVIFIGWIRLFEYFLILYIGTVSQNVLIVCLNYLSILLIIDFIGVLFNFINNFSIYKRNYSFK